MISSNDITSVQDFSDCVEYKDNFIPLMPVRMSWNLRRDDRVIKRARPRRQHRWVVRGNLKRDDSDDVNNPQRLIYDQLEL